MHLDGNCMTGGPSGVRHVPLPAPAHYPAQPERPRGLDWSKHTAPAIDRGAIEQLERQGLVTVTDETLDGRRVKVVRKTKRRPGPHLGVTYPPRFDVARAIELYQAGRTISECARAVGAKPSSVRSWLIQAGIHIRAKSQTRVDVAEILRLHATGATTARIATAVGCGETSVRSHLRDNGLTPNEVPRSGENNPRFRSEIRTEDLVRDYRAGMTIPELAAAYEADRKMVYKRIRASGIPMRDDRGTGAEYVRRHGVTAAQVRAWARETGRDCPRGGPVPRPLVDAFINESATTRRASA